MDYPRSFFEPVEEAFLLELLLDLLNVRLFGFGFGFGLELASLVGVGCVEDLRIDVETSGNGLALVVVERRGEGWVLARGWVAVLRAEEGDAVP